MRHAFECHSTTPNFSYTCDIDGCVQTFRTFPAMTSHIRKKHGGSDSDPTIPPVSFITEQDELEESNQFQESDTISAMSLPPPPSSSSYLARRSTAQLFLNLKEKHRLTQSAISFTIEQVQQILNHTLDDIKSSIKHEIGEVDMDRFFDINPFEGLSTEHLQTKFYCEHFGLIVSKHAPSNLSIMYVCTYFRNLLQ